MSDGAPGVLTEEAFEAMAQDLAVRYQVSQRAGRGAVRLYAELEGDDDAFAAGVLRAVRAGEPWAVDFSVHYVRALVSLADEVGQETGTGDLPEHTDDERERMCVAIAELLAVVPFDEVTPQITGLLATQYRYSPETAEILARVFVAQLSGTPDDAAPVG